MALKILLVENDELDQSGFTRLVSKESLPYDYVIADSVATCLPLLKQRQFDVVLIDYMLGDGTGLDVLKLIPANVPAILITGAGSEETAVEAMRSGASDYIIKDYDRTYLTLLPMTIERAIRTKGDEKKRLTLSHAMMSSGDSIFISNLDNIITFVNDKFCSTYAYAEEEIIGRTCTILYSPDGQLPAGDEFIDFECVHIRKGGEFFPVSMSRSTIRDDQGLAFARMVISHDITNRKKSEQKLLESEERYRSVVAVLAEGIVMQDKEGKILTSNTSAERILGLTLDQMMGRTSVDPGWRAIHEDGSLFPGDQHPAMETLRTGEPQHNVIMGVHKPSGELTWISINSQPLIHTGEEQPFAVVATFTDITEFRKAQQEAFSAALDKERHEILSEFVQDALHEFRTPITTIRMSTYLLGKSLGERSHQQRIDKINMQADAISRLVDDMMLMWKLDHHYPMNQAQFDIGDLIRQTITVFRQSHAHIFELECQDAAIHFYGDNHLIGIVYRNILQNAIDHSPDDMPITTRVVVSENDIDIQVEDRGKGMDDHELAQIFKRFYRGDAAHTLRGFGLGLPIAKAILDHHNGKIEVSSIKNKGTIATIRLSQRG